MSQFVKQKAFGQNFLVNDSIIGRIIDSIDHSLSQYPVKQMFEIGPGLGALTRPWTERHPELPLTLIEKDREIAEKWKTTTIPQLTLRLEDAVDTDYHSLFRSEPVGLFSNLPYSVGTRIFTKLAEHPHEIKFMVLMFQKEVAERILLKPKTVGSLGIWSQNVWDIEKVLLVPPSAFKPKPKIDSLVIKCIPRPQARIPQTQSSEAHKKLWQDLLKLAFSHRRKMLRSIFNDHALWKSGLTDSKVPETLRAEALTWEHWSALFQSCAKHWDLQ
ncbi:MAG: ribosomal RNA small subunit methyltransferase A [Xanthomonadaceae bacterium]|nr:ribosomal RNA small subunit methyltransferase A [Xanthomonadaceae bacterium]